MDEVVRERLLTSIETGRLVIVCGAGLSMALPSALPNARNVANSCYAKYTSGAIQQCPPALRDNLEELAEYFLGRNQFHSIFIPHLVPWEDFARPPNTGHAAIADFLLTGTVSAAVSANFDSLIEDSARRFGADFYPSLTGDEANLYAHRHRPLLKFHGCLIRDRAGTVWARSQLVHPAVADRLANCRNWMSVNLREKDLLIVGFWSDWPYFNTIVSDVFTGAAPTSVTLVDPTPGAALNEKAPDLWALAHMPHVQFAHVRESAADVLNELRVDFSRGFLRKVLHSGRLALERRTGAQCDEAWLHPPEGLAIEDYYALRRDAEGVPAGHAARLGQPSASELVDCNSH